MTPYNHALTIGVGTRYDINTRFIADREAIRRRKEQLIDKYIQNENKNCNKEVNKYKEPYKGPYEITKVWKNGPYVWAPCKSA